MKNSGEGDYLAEESKLDGSNDLFLYIEFDELGNFQKESSRLTYKIEIVKVNDDGVNEVFLGKNNNPCVSENKLKVFRSKNFNKLVIH